MIRLNAPKTRDKQTFDITELKGIDAWNDALTVSPNRAVSMRNLENRNGVNHKRHGWEQAEDIYPGAIDGYYVCGFNGKKYEIVYAGCKFYVKIDGALSATTYTNDKLISNPGKFYEHDGKVFIIGCGDYLVFVPKDDGTFLFTPVQESEYAYVPLTYISDYYNSDRGLAVVAGEKSNMLSSYRINKFYDANCSEESRTYRLDVYTDTPTTTPVVDDVLSSKITWTTEKGYENVFSVVEHLEAYRLIVKDDVVTKGYYKFTYCGKQYYVPSYPEDTKTTKIILRKGYASDFRIEVNDERRWAESAPDATLPVYEAELVKTGAIANDLYGYDLSNHTIKFSGTTDTGTLKNSSACRYIDSSGVERKIRWIPTTYKEILGIEYADWDNCYLTDGTYTYAVATRSSWLVPYSCYAGQDMIKKYPDGFDGMTLTYATSFTFPEGSTCDFIAKRSWIKLYDQDDVEIEGLGYIGYTLAYTAEDGRTEYIGTICPYSGEFTVGRRITETWGGVGSEKLPSIAVKYKTHNSEAGKIAKCTVSTLFGLNGNSDRLFVGGNPDYPNIDWHSGYTDKSGKSGNFGYFESDSSAALGTPSSAIKGYQRLSDGTLAVYKEKSNKEATLYLRSGVSETDSNGRIIEYYPNNGGYVTEGAINSECFGVLGSDMLMLCDNGVFGLEISENVASQQRFLKERSKPVNPLLKRHSLKDARAIVFEDKYLLAVDGKVYVADGRYTRKEYGDMSDTFSYEWYVWDNCPVRTWISDGKKLGFGTTDGRICFFTDAYVDSCYVNVKYPDFGFDRRYGEGWMTISDYINVPTSGETDGKVYNRTIYKNVLGGIVGPWTIKFMQYSVLVTYNGGSPEYTTRFLQETVKQDGYLYFTSDYINACNGKRKVLSVDYDALTIICEHTPGDKWMIAEGGEKYTESQKPPNVDFILVEIGEGYSVPNSDIGLYTASKRCGAFGFIGLWFNNEELSKSKPDISMRIYGDVPVTAYWQTGALNFGTNFYVKQLESVSTLTEGHMKIGFETRSDNGYDIDIGGANRPFDFENLNLKEIAFSNLMDDASGATLCARSVKKTFGVLVLRVENSDNEDFVIHQISFIYKLLRKMKGAR